MVMIAFLGEGDRRHDLMYIN